MTDFNPDEALGRLLEQGELVEGMVGLARALVAFHNELINADFDEENAFSLTTSFMYALIERQNG